MKPFVVLVFLCIVGCAFTLWPQPNKIVYGEEDSEKQNLNLFNFHLNLQFKEATQETIKSDASNSLQQHYQKFLKKYEQYLELIYQRLNKKSKQKYQQQLSLIQQDNEESLLKKQDYPIILDIEDIEYFRINQDTDESYTLQINDKQTLVKASNYYGFLRAIETLSQLIDTNYQIKNIPIYIEDQPYMTHRGLMLDCARHFMPVSTILRTIDAMQYNKLNVLHLHLTDDESFPLYIEEEPQITYTGAYSQNQIYSKQDVQTILQHGNQAGVRIIPEVDSPSHARSWGLIEKYATCNILCPGSEHYNGQLDITLDLTYELVEKVVNSTQNLFTDDYIHLGGDEVITSCYDKRPSIKTWMANNKIETKDYIGLQQYYRSQQAKMLKSGKSPVYWCNEQLNIPPTKDQILQYWGDYDNLNMLLDVPNKIIISAEDKLYINTGQGFVFGNAFGTYLTWQTVYDFDPLPTGFTKDRILGAEACLWSEVNNEYTVDNNLWIRGSALAERLWTQTKDTTLQLVTRLDEQQKLLVSRGIQASPATSEYCAKYPSQCFSN